MRIALIPPVCMLHHTVKQELQMMIPQGLDSEMYRRHYKWLGISNNYHVILDNGMFETGTPIDDQDLLDIAAEYKVSEIVMPDVRDDPDATIDRQDQFLSLYDKWAGRIPRPLKLMAVVQGKTAEEAQRYVNFVVKAGRNNVVLGFPRRMTEDYGPEARIVLMSWLAASYGSEFPMHMLGLSRANPMELQGAAKRLGSYIRGIDTSAPFVWTAENKHLDTGDIVERQDDYMTMEAARFPGPLVRHNIETLERWARGE